MRDFVTAVNPSSSSAASSAAKGFAVVLIPGSVVFCIVAFFDFSAGFALPAGCGFAFADAPADAASNHFITFQ